MTRVGVFAREGTRDRFPSLFPLFPEELRSTDFHLLNKDDDDNNKNDDDDFHCSKEAAATKKKVNKKGFQLNSFHLF